MGDKEDKISDTQNGDSKDIIVTDVGVRNKELTELHEAHNVNNDISYSNGEQIQNEVQSHVESVDTCGKDDSEKPSFNVREEGPLNKPSVITSNVNEIHVDLPVESPCVEPSGTFLETQIERETKTKSNEIESNREVGKMEEELNSERSGKTLNGEVNLTLESERIEEKMISGSNGLEFHQDDKRNDRDFENDNGVMEEVSGTVMVKEEIHENEIKKELIRDALEDGVTTEFNSVNSSFLLGPDSTEEDETGTPEEQIAFLKEIENFHRERFLDFRPPRFYQEPLNLLKLWRATVRLGGYEQVTSCKLWRQIGESFKPPKTCTTVSWTFRSFYEKALLEYEKHKLRCGELPYTELPTPEHIGVGTPLQAVGSGRLRRDAASRAMQGWHSRLLGNGEVGDSPLKDKISPSSPRCEKPLKSIGLLKRKMPSAIERAVKVVHMKTSDPQSEADVVDIGHPADWVKVNVQRTKDCFEVYALIPGLLREEVRVQSDAVGRLVISGQPDQLDNPWGVTPFRKVVSLPSRIDPHQTSAVVTLHGQLFVRVPFDPLDI